jgi:hypothetical protein
MHLLACTESPPSAASNGKPAKKKNGSGMQETGFTDQPANDCNKVSVPVAKYKLSNAKMPKKLKNVEFISTFTRVTRRWG